MFWSRADQPELCDSGEAFAKLDHEFGAGL
jgi:hypothetical protein